VVGKVLLRWLLLMRGKLPTCQVLWPILLLLSVGLDVQVPVISSVLHERVVWCRCMGPLQVIVELQGLRLPSAATDVATVVSETWAVSWLLLRMLRRVEPRLRAALVGVAWWWMRRLRRRGAGEAQ
jgi:hypothetical protein